MGFYLEGIYVGQETREYKNEDGSVDVRHSINIATGSLAYRVYLEDNFDYSKLDNLQIGEVVTVKCRVYCGKNNKLVVVDGDF